MTIGILINTKGKFFEFNYSNVSNLEQFIQEKGNGKFTILEKPSDFIVLGYESGTNFNMFDLETVNACGDILIISNKNKDISVENIIDYYEGEDLDDDLIEDELRRQEEEELDDDDLLDFIDYDDDYSESD
tara:strand:- start:2510 stop:2902 length:393 start_codon:yes stop_codon:yes gene_type:complete